MDIHFHGLILGISAFLCIGLWHPIVIKTEYYFGTKVWWIYLLIGILCICGSLFVENIYVSAFLGIFAFSALWGIHELFRQEKRVEKGWFPRNPNRKYKDRPTKNH